MAEDPEGRPVISCGDVTVFLWPDESGWAVCSIEKGQRPSSTAPPEPGPLVRHGVGRRRSPEDFQTFGVTKGAAWRKKKPSDKVVALAGRLGIPTENRRAGDVGDDISIFFAAKIFDPNV